MACDAVKESTTLTEDRGILSGNLISVADRIWFSKGRDRLHAATGLEAAWKWAVNQESLPQGLL
jgi:hypothetical protein